MTALTSPIGYYRKAAKDLCDEVRTGGHEARRRVGVVFRDLAESADAAFGLQRAQHVVAVEHGFTSWQTLLEASPIQQRLAITLLREPLLNDFGIGMFRDHYRLPEADRRAVFEENRQRLRRSAHRVEATANWLLQNVPATKTINEKHTSYGIKHTADKDIGYVTNGVFIAAAIIADYPYKIPADSPNVMFGMSERALREIASRRSNPTPVLQRFTVMAADHLRARGLEPFFESGRGRTQLAWREDGDVRTLAVTAVERTPFLVRLSLDHFGVMVSQRTAKAMRLPHPSFISTATPVRPNSEITLLPDEVERALAWALAHDARALHRPALPPFEEGHPRNEPPGDGWTYVWSRRAATAYQGRAEVANAAE